MKLTYQSYGAGIALGICDKRDDVQQFANWLYNFGITNSEPNFLCETFAYVLVFDILKFKKFMVENGRTNLVATMEIDNFIQQSQTPEAYQLGKIE
jgi:hypothetical protein